MCTVDILLATYNGADFLPEQLASLAAQTHTDWHLIIRDDGSTDGSLELVRDWAAYAGRTLVIVEDDEICLGPAQSFARLLERSDAPFFAFCDQDDVWESDKLARLIAATETIGEGIILAHCDLAVVDSELTPLAPSFWQQQLSNANLRESMPGNRGYLLFQNPVTGCAMLGNAALRDAMLPLPSDASMHDWWAALTAAYRGRIVSVDAPLVYYRQHGRNSIGARSRTLGAMAKRLMTEPVAVFEHTYKIFDALSRQAFAVLDRFGDAMTKNEHDFTFRFASLDTGLGCLGGWHLAAWALLERRRWPLVAHLIIETFAGRGRRTEN